MLDDSERNNLDLGWLTGCSPPTKYRKEPGKLHLQRKLLVGFLPFSSGTQISAAQISTALHPKRIAEWRRPRRATSGVFGEPSNLFVWFSFGQGNQLAVQGEPGIREDSPV